MTWNELSARQRRWIVLGGVGFAFFAASWVITEGLAGGEGKSRREQINEAILTDADTRQTTIDRLAAQLESSRSENADLTQKVEQLAERQQGIPDAVAAQLQKGLDQTGIEQRRALESRIVEMEGQLGRLDELLLAAKEDQKEQARQLDIAATDTETPDETEPQGSVDVSATPGIVFPETEKTEPTTPEDIFKAPAPLQPAAGQPPAAAGAEQASASSSGVLAIRFVSKSDAAAADPAVADNQSLPEDGETLFKLPATSILTGTLITGLDAPTGAQAQGEPLPVLLRLKKEAILPNRYKADVRECFALLGAYGDLASERAHMRGETMSCILDDGTILEQPLKAFAVGEDGKEGPRGRLVRREGTFIARALLVGFLEAAANAFDDNQVAVIGGGADFDVQGAQEAAASFGGAAAGNALGRVADWYIDQAFQL
ncbi:MAG: TrbI/VirB10 family protein, partial [Geminicoccaceae bacterium]